MMPKAHLLVEDYAGVAVVKFKDPSILDRAVIDEIARQLYLLTDQEQRLKVVLDFSSVQSLSSQALGVLLTLNSKAKAIGGSLALCGIRKELMKLFKITKLEGMFKFYPDDAAALASFDVYVS